MGGASNFLLVAALLFAVQVLADTCETVASTSAIKVEQPLSAEYSYDQTQYWSTGCSALKPSCIFSPETTEEVAAIVRILNQNNETFAIKSGGHNPNQYWSSIAGGPLLSTRLLNEVTLDAATKTVRVGPGNRWDDVQAKLQGSGFTVVGGRIGNVGVGGYLIGGGLSFLSAEYGWAASSVVAFTVVLANGTIVTASKDSNADLYRALKGGGNNYGVVTSYLLEAHPQDPQVWGGTYTFDISKTSSLIAAIRDFTEYSADPKAAVIMTSEITLVGAVRMWVLFVCYDGPTPPPGTFDNFTSIGPSLSNVKTQTYSDLLTANNVFVVRGSIYTITTETTPLPNKTVGAEVLQTYFDHWKNTTTPILGVSGLIASIAFQPVPKMLARTAKEKGGDLIDLDDDVDRIIFEFNYSYLLDVDTPKVDAATVGIYEGMKARRDEFVAQGKLPQVYNPLFANDAYYRQDYFGRLRTESFAKQVQQKYDPNGFFTTRTGGWKI